MNFGADAPGRLARQRTRARDKRRLAQRRTHERQSEQQAVAHEAGRHSNERDASLGRRLGAAAQVAIAVQQVGGACPPVRRSDERRAPRTACKAVSKGDIASLARTYVERTKRRNLMRGSACARPAPDGRRFLAHTLPEGHDEPRLLGNRDELRWRDQLRGGVVHRASASNPRQFVGRAAEDGLVVDREILAF